MTTSDIHSLSGAYALDAVDDLERAAFERHLRECDACALEVSELRETVSRLADTAAVEPPPSLRASVLDAVTRTPQAPPGRPGRSQSTSHAAAARWRRFAAVSVAAGVLAAGAGVGTWAVASRNVDDARRVAVAAQQRAAEIEQVLAAPDLKVFTTPIKDGGSVNVAVARSVNKAVAILNDLPGLGDDQVYQLWMIPEASVGKPASPGPLAIGQTTGSQVLTVGNAVQFGVTIEPPGGSPQPSTDPVGIVTITE
jgi:anti-sigma-K factor RskA